MSSRGAQVFSERVAGLDLYLDLRQLEPSDRERARTALRDALTVLESKEEDGN